MKTTNRLFVLLLFLIYSCNAPTGVEMKQESTIAIELTDTNETILKKATHVIPTPNQFEALKTEYMAFIHFGPNTFSKREWGNGKENPEIFNLQNLDTDQWCKTMKSAGMKMVVFTAKHHDGFVLFQSRYTKHGVMSSPFKNGKGDVLKELSESCEKYGLKLGIYLSPADLYQIENKEGLYGNLSKYSERVIPKAVEGRPFKDKRTFKFMVDDYNEYYLNQLFELLTEYGPIHEVWLDGAHPKRKGGQKYNYLAWKELISELAPEAVVFGKQDVRWCGNEAGITRETEWNVIPYQEDPRGMNSFVDLTNIDLGSREKLYQGKFLHYQQGEVDTSIREGWFYRNDDEQKVRNADDVFDIYERSVGGNATLIMNIPPNREGRFSPRDVEALIESGRRIKSTYTENLLEGGTGPIEILDENENSFLLIDGTKEVVITTKKPILTNRFVIQEAITTHSERIEKHALDAWLGDEWKEIASATNIGYKKILRFPEIETNKFRIRVLKSRNIPAISGVKAHYYQPIPPEIAIEIDSIGRVTIAPKKHEFKWKPHGENTILNINGDIEIRYTIDGTTPDKNSKRYTAPFSLKTGVVKATAFVKEKSGNEAILSFK
ncbi:alpha-L-fucosidase [Flavobacteriaceae bacterium]|nr:alpha-L-fucosidase [Flavobacteriaceae bacterium]